MFIARIPPSYLEALTNIVLCLAPMGRPKEGFHLLNDQIPQKRQPAGTQMQYLDIVFGGPPIPMPIPTIAGQI